MSDKQRKKRWWRSVTAVVSTVALGIGGVAVPQVAGAYTLDTSIPRGFGEEVSTVVDNDGVERPAKARIHNAQWTVNAPDGSTNNEVQLSIGTEFEYVLNLTVEPRPDFGISDPIQPGQSDLFADGKQGSLELSFDFDKAIEADPFDEWTFNWSRVQGADPILFSSEKDPEDEDLGERSAIFGDVNPQLESSNNYLLKFKSGVEDENGEGGYFITGDPLVDLEVKIPVKVVGEIQDGKEILAQSFARVGILPHVETSEVARQYDFISTENDPNGECSSKSTYLFKVDGGGYGTWLEDVRLGTLQSDVSEIVDPVVRIYDSDPRLGDNRSETRRRDLEDLATKSPASEMDSSQLSAPSGVDLTTFVNWPFHPDKLTGKAWLNDSYVEVEHYLQNEQCLRNPEAYIGSEPTQITGSWVKIDTASWPRDTYDWEQLRSKVRQAPSVQTSSVGDRVWIDANRNGVQDEGEENLAGVNVTVTPPAGSDEQPRTATTDADGKWRVDGLTPGVEYTVSFEVPDGYKATDALVGEDRGVDSNGLRSTVTLQPGEFNDTYDLGVFQQASVGDFVWEDTNGDGIQDDGEPAVPNTIVRVTGPNGETHTTATDKDGKWSVDGLTPGVEYTVEFTPPAGYQVTKTEQGEDRGKDSNPLSSTVSLKPGENNTSYDLGLVKPASIGDRVWVDENENGIQDENEKNGVPNARVTVTAPEGVDEQPRTTTTDDKGNWRIDGLTPGVEYTVTFELPEGVSATKSLVGDDRGVDSNELSTKITLESDQHDPTFDLGVVPASIGDRVWLDEGDEEKVGRADGIQDDGEGGIADVVVRVSRPGEEVRETKTGANGTWKIEGLTPGVDDYRVEFDAPDGYRISPTKAGNAAVDSNGLSDKVAALKSGEFNDTYDLGLFIDVPETTTVTTPVPTVETTEVSPTPCDCSPTTVPTTVTSKVPVPTTKTQSVPTTVEKAVPTTVQTTTTAEAPKRGTIGDRVWEDANGDGVEDPDEKTGVPNVPVVIVDKEGNEVTRTVTDESGNWKVDVEPGEYTVRYETGDRTPSDPELVERTIVIEPGEENFEVDLGILPSGSVGDRVWNDEDGDGEQGEGEKGLENVVVLVSREGEPTRSAVTDENGDWKIEGLNPDVEYEVRFIKPEGWEATGKVPGSDESGLVSKVTVKPNEYNDTYDLGLKKLDPDCDCEPVKPGTIGDRVWIDENGDGKEDPDEKTGVPNVTVIVEDPEGNEVTRTVTDESGNWKVDVEPGEYTVRYEPGDRTPSDPELVERTIVIEPGENRDDIDLGILPSGSVGDRVWNDEDGDGEQGGDEKGLENVVVLVSREGEPTRSTVTDENGDWKIEGLNPDAEYEVRFIKPEGWEVTGKVPGSDESGLVSKVTVKPNEYNDTYDLGLKKLDPDCDCEPVKPGTIGNRVWIDLNGNGKQDPNETEGAPDVTVIVRDADGNEVTRTVTDEDGNWKVNVEPGDYEIEYRPRDWKPTDPKRVTQKVTVEEGKQYLDLDLGVQKPKPGEPTPPTDGPAPDPEKGSSTETLDRCVANAVRSPLLYLVPVALLGAFGGEIARPYMGAINEQVNQINAQFQEAMRRNSPDWGRGGRGGRDNDQFAELRGQIDAANRRIAELGQDPNVQRFGTVAAGIIGLIAAGGVLYDWCSNEKGEAFTSIGGSSAKESDAEGRQSSSKDAA